MNIGLNGATFTSDGTVAYFANGNGYFSGSHYFDGGGAATNFSQLTSYRGTISAQVSSAACWHAIVEAYGVFGASQRVMSGQQCYSPPPPPPDPITIYDDSGCPAYQNCNSPIILNLGNGGYRLTSTEEPVMFDLDADGTPERTSWTAAGAPMAFLALDRNGNGVIDSGSELFGNHTPLRSGTTASNGFVALAEYDANGDGLIDRQDPIWSSLLVWTDVNHDGVSQPDEIQPVAASPVTAIELDFHWTGRRDVSGNVFRYEAHVRLEHEVRPCYDIYFLAAS